MAPEKTYSVLFLRTHNSARSVMAECIPNREGRCRFRAFSAGSSPSGRINQQVLDLLRTMDRLTGDLRSKSWEEFTRPGTPPPDLVFTVRDNAAGGVCPVWPASR